MPYIKTNWQDRLVEKPNTFEINDNGDGTANITESAGEVFVAGTPVSAENMNKIEAGIENATNLAETAGTVANQTEAETGTDNTKKMTPLRVLQAINKRTTDLIATSAEAIAGLTNFKLMSPLRTKEFVNDFAISKKTPVTATTFPNLNDVRTPGMYAVNQPDVNNRSLNYPPSGANYAFLLVANTINTQTLQIFAGHSSNQFLYRVGFENNWTAWQRLPLGTEIGNLADLTTTTKTNLVAAINEIKTSQSIATQNEAETGTDNTKSMSPLRVSQSVAKRLRDYSKLNLYNLLEGSYDLSKGTWSNVSSWIRETGANQYLNYPTWKRSEVFSGLGQNLTLPVGTYTVTVMAKTDADTSCHLFVQASNGGKINNADSGSVVLGTILDWTLVRYQFNVTTMGTFNCRFEKNSGTGAVYQSLLGVYEGAVERKWFNGINDNSYEVATDQEVLDGTNDGKIVTPLKLRRSRLAKTSDNPTDLDFLLTVGNYFYGGSARPNNTPSEVIVGNGFYVEVIQSLNQLTVQRITQPVGGVVLSRTRYDFNNNLWTPWKLLSRDVATQSEAQTATNNEKVMTPLRTNELITAKYGLGGFVQTSVITDYNQILSTGFTRMPNNSTNAPINQFCNLMTIARNSDVVSQIAFCDAEVSRKVFIRFKNVSWSDWEDLTTSKTTGNLAQLQTSQKGNLVAAINEAFQFANDGKTRIADVVGAPLVTSDTFTQMETKIQTIKTKFRDNLVAQGVPADNTEALDSLVDKIPLIQAGVRSASGTETALNGEFGFRYVNNVTTLTNLLVVYGLPFRPKKIIVRYQESPTSYIETFFDTTRPINPISATMSRYSVGSGSSTNQPIRMDSENGFVTDSSFSIPVLLPSVEYTWYIEG